MAVILVWQARVLLAGDPRLPPTSRVVLHMSEADLARFHTEYDELLTRYRLLHDKPAPGTREVTVRPWAFPR
jgi:hypothetical protein